VTTPNPPRLFPGASSLMNRRGQYQIRNATDSPSATEILLYDEIGEDPWFGTGVSAKQFVEDLNAIETDEIHLRINSPGGNVFEGVAMLNAVRRHKAKVTVFVDGLAASAASVLAMGGDEVVMSRNAELMIHDAWGIAIGNEDEMTKMATDLARASNNLASAYADKAGGTTADWREAMKAETWYSDKEAVAAGLADRVEPSKTASDKAKAKFNLSMFAYAGRAEAPAPYFPAEPENSTSSTEEGSDMPDTLAIVRQRLGLSADANEAAILAALPATEPDPDETEPELPAEDPDEDEPPTEEGETGTEPTIVNVSEEIFNQMRKDAEAGRKAYDAQQATHRDTLVNAAVRDGRISPARKADWLNKLTKDPGSESELASLAKGLIPVDGPRGYTGSLTDVGEGADDAVYNALFAQPKGA
jgi:ATP-dependent protease ClpP protease subunit